MRLFENNTKYNKLTKECDGCKYKGVHMCTHINECTDRSNYTDRDKTNRMNLDIKKRG